jgi:hypothetical protein
MAPIDAVELRERLAGRPVVASRRPMEAQP